MYQDIDELPFFAFFPILTSAQFHVIHFLSKPWIFHFMFIYVLCIFRMLPDLSVIPTQCEKKMNIARRMETQQEAIRWKYDA